MKLFIIFVTIFFISFVYASEEKMFDDSVSEMYLHNPNSMKDIFPDGKMKLIENGGYHFNLENNKQTEVFTAVFHEGGSTMYFSIFVVKKKPENFNEKIHKRLKKVETFRTGKGINLGMSKIEVIKILGGGFSINKKNELEIIEYKIEGLDNSKALKKHNMPEYFGKYIFKDDKLVEFSFGFPYP